MIRRMGFHWNDELTLEPSTPVVTVFLEGQIHSLVIDANLTLILEVVSDSGEARAAKGAFDA